MRRAQEISAQGPGQEHVRRFDLREIDALPPSFWTRRYRARIDRVIATVEERLPAGSLILDVACAQGNVAIMLGERGFRVLGLDLRKAFLDYGKKKDDHHVVSWVVGNCMVPPLAPGVADGVLLGEVLEHVARPDVLLARALGLVRAGGLVICTTPNGACFRNSEMDSYETARHLPDLEARQFGPAGEHHLFALRPEELLRLAPSNVTPKLDFAVSALWNRMLGVAARSAIASQVVEGVSRLRLWRRWLCDSLILVVEKRS